MRYVEAKLEQGEVESAYRFFISEGIRAIAKNTAGGEECMTFNIGFMQWKESRYAPKETRTADEIISNISEKLDFLGGQNDSI